MANPSDDQILNERESAEMMRCSVATLRRLNIPVARITGRGTGRNAHVKLYLRSELFAYVRRHLTLSLLEPVAGRSPGNAEREREKNRGRRS